MNSEGPSGRRSRGRGGRSTAFENAPQKIPKYRYEFLQTLPSQVLRPLAAARDPRRSIRARRASHAEAKYQVSIYMRNNSIWDGGLADSLQRRGLDTVDRDNVARQYQTFLARVGLRTLEKRYNRESAIGAAQLELEQLGVLLGLPDGH